MLIEIPDDLARKVKRKLGFPAVEYRRRAECSESVTAAHYLMLAAIVEADLPEPIQVGHLAQANDYTFLVLALGRERAFLEDHEGWETSRPIADLTYAGPKPEGWGEQ